MGAVPTIVVYSKSNNLNIVRLHENGEPVALTTITKIELRLRETGEAISSSDYPDAVSWAVGNERRGLVYLRLGSLFFTTKTYSAEVIVFDPVNPLGIYFGNMRIRAIEERVSG